jgi:hypothetical protein
LGIRDLELGKNWLVVFFYGYTARKKGIGNWKFGIGELKPNSELQIPNSCSPGFIALYFTQRRDNATILS